MCDHVVFEIAFGSETPTAFGALERKLFFGIFLKFSKKHFEISAKTFKNSHQDAPSCELWAGRDAWMFYYKYCIRFSPFLRLQSVKVNQTKTMKTVINIQKQTAYADALFSCAWQPNTSQTIAIRIDHTWMAFEILHQLKKMITRYKLYIFIWKWQSNNHQYAFSCACQIFVENWRPSRISDTLTPSWLDGRKLENIHESFKKSIIKW